MKAHTNIYSRLITKLLFNQSNSNLMFLFPWNLYNLVLFPFLPSHPSLLISPIFKNPNTLVKKFCLHLINLYFQKKRNSKISPVFWMGPYSHLLEQYLLPRRWRKYIALWKRHLAGQVCPQEMAAAVMCSFFHGSKNYFVLVSWFQMIKVL